MHIIITFHSTPTRQTVEPCLGTEVLFAALPCPRPNIEVGGSPVDLRIEPYNGDAKSTFTTRRYACPRRQINGLRPGLYLFSNDDGVSRKPTIGIEFARRQVFESVELFANAASGQDQRPRGSG